VTAFLDSKGLGRWAEKIVEVTDAEFLDDLKLIDAAMLQEVVDKVGLKLVSAKKFRLAIAELHGEVPAATEEQESQALQPSDAPTEDVAAAFADAPAMPETQECVAICIDRSGSMGSPFAELTLNVVKGTERNSVAERTRMEAVKAMFYAFRDRVENVGRGRHHIGLLQFDDRVERLLDLTPRLDRFETIVDDMAKRGTTAIYSAIVEAALMLEPHFQKDPQADFRILALTDGQNNTGAPPEEALAAANAIGAVVDAIIVGDRPDANLRRIVSATGGECYQIRDLGEGFELLEAESVVSLKARRGDVEKPPFQPREMVDFASIAEKTMTCGAAVQRAPVVAPDFIAKAVVDVASLQDGAAVLSTVCNSSASTKRVLKELKQVSSGAASVWLHSGEGVHIFPAPESLHFWRALIEGPPNSPFEGGVFALTVRIPDNYPFAPPKITFETPVYHCNTSDSGGICLDVLQDKWCPDFTVPKCLEAIRIMLQTPDTDNSLRQWIAELTLAHQKSNGSDTRYYDKAHECTRRDASLTVTDWKQKWGCGGEP